MVRRTWLCCLILVALAGAAYATSFKAGLPYDNWGVILRNQALRDPHALPQVLMQDWWGSRTNLYRPLTSAALWFDTAIVLNGSQNPDFLRDAPNPTWYHIINLLLHVGCVLLVFALVRAALEPYQRPGEARADLLAACAAALWAVHPLGVEAVTNIIGRADELATLGVLGGLYLYTRAIRTPAPGAAPPRRWMWLIAAALVGLLGMLSKENAIVLPLLAVWWDLCVRRLTLPQVPAAARYWGVLCVPVLLMLVLRAAVIGLFPDTPPDFAANPIQDLPWLEGRLTALGVLGSYVAQFCLPVFLSCDYSPPATPWGWNALNGLIIVPYLAVLALLGGAIAWLSAHSRKIDLGNVHGVPAVWRSTFFRYWCYFWCVGLLLLLADCGLLPGLAGALGLLALAGSLAAAIFAWRHDRRDVALWLGFFGLAILPVSNLLFAIGTIRGDRLMYLPMVGLCVLVVLAIEWLAREAASRRKIVIIATAVLVLLLGARTAVQNLVWQDDQTLWGNAAGSAKANDQYAWALYTAANGKLSPALLEKLLDLGQRAVAVQASLPLRWQTGSMWGNLAIYQTSAAESARPEQRPELYQQAAKSFERAITLARESAAARAERRVLDEVAIDYATALNYGTLKLKLGDRTGAADLYDLASRCAPQKDLVWLTRAKLAGGQQDWPTAARCAWAAALLRRSADAENLLATIYAQRDPTALTNGQLDRRNPTAQSDLAAAFQELTSLLTKRQKDTTLVARRYTAIRNGE